jgi:hypothetical protein
MTIKKEEIRKGETYIEDLIGKEVIVREIRPILGVGPAREVYVELPEKPGCGVWQDEELFASIHSKKLLAQTKVPVQKRSFFARLLRLR